MGHGARPARPARGADRTLTAAPFNSCLSREEAAEGAALWALLEDPAQWVHRRVESVRIVDHLTARRRVSIDLTVPEPAFSLPGIPLTFLKKEVMKRFDLRDAAGVAVPMLTREQQGRVIGNALVYTAETHVQLSLGTGDPLPADVADSIRGIVEADRDGALHHLMGLAERARDEAAPLGSVWRAVAESEPVMDMLARLAESFVLIAACEPRVGHRQLIKLAYDEELTVGVAGRVLKSAGWEVERLLFEAPTVALCASYHLEVLAPADLEVVDARMTFVPLGARRPIEDAPAGHAVGPATPDIHWNFRRADPAFRAGAEIALRPERRGFVTAAALVGSLVAALLGAALWRLDEIADPQQSQVTSALLLLAPAVFGAFIVRPGEHRLASRMLFGVRALLVVNLGAAIFAVVMLALGIDGGALTAAWWVAFGVALVTAVGLVRPAVSPPGS